MTQAKEKAKQPPYAILRGGYKYKETLGMRRVTTYCMDIVETEEILYVLIRADGESNWPSPEPYSPISIVLVLDSCASAVAPIGTNPFSPSSFKT